MRIWMLTILGSILSFAGIGQNQTFEVFGTISGNHSSEIFLFYEGNYKKKDSLSAEIKNGQFYFKANAPLPIQARFHLGGNSLIEDVYIDSKKTVLACKSAINKWGQNNDTLFIFNVTDVKGSKSESLKRSFESWLTTLNGSAKTGEEKRQEYYDQLYNFVKKHPSDKISPYLVAKASTLRYAQVELLNSMINPSLQSTYEGKSVARLLNRLDKTKNKAIGISFLDVTLKSTSGTDFSTKDLRGKYVLVDFWASWCGPCREMNPELKTLYGKLKDKGFEILGVSFDKDHAKWTEAIAKDGLTWMQVIDEKGFSGALAEHYAIESIPENILLDKSGKILAVGRLSATEIENIVEKAL